MTAPINFPTIQAPQVVAPKRSDLDGFAEFLAALSAQRDERAVRREQLDMQRRQLANSETKDKFQMEQDKRKLEQDELLIQADEAAERYAREITTDPGADENTISAVLARAVSENKKIAPFISKAIMQQVQQQQQTLASVAQRKAAQSGAVTAGVNADVATATKDDRIAAGKLEDEVVAAQLTAANHAAEASRLGAILARDQINLDPARRSQISQFMAAGKTLGEAYRAVGRTVPAGADPNFRLDAGDEGGAAGAAARKQKGLAAQAQLGVETLRAAGSIPLSVGADIFRVALAKEGVLGAGARALANKSLTPAERQTVQGYMLLGQAYMVHVTGATATNTQSQVFMNTIVAFASDDPKTIQQKITIQNLLPQLIAQGLGPSDIARAMAAEAAKLGMNEKQLKALRAQVPVAQKYEASPEYQQKVKGAAAAPTDAVNGALARAGIRPPTP